MAEAPSSDWPLRSSGSSQYVLTYVRPSASRSSAGRAPHSTEAVTFGIEIEMIVSATKGPYGHLKELPASMSVEWDPKVCQNQRTPLRIPDRHIAVFLREKNIKAMTMWERVQIDTTGALRDRFPAKGHYKDRGAYDDYFLVKGDASIEVEQAPNDKDTPIGIELSTPVLPFIPSSLGLINEVLSALFEAFDVSVNASCGLHVHVGNGDKGYDLAWLQSIASLLWSGSALLDCLHPVHRGPAHLYSLGLHHFATLAHTREIMRYKGPFAPTLQSVARPFFRETPGSRWSNDPAYYMRREAFYDSWIQDPLMIWCGLQQLKETKTINELLGYMFHVNPGFEGKRLAYNFRNLRFQNDDESLVPRTIEFRQHEGTVDIEAICMWTRVVCSLVEACRDNPYRAENAALKAVNATLGLGRYDAIDILRDIGLRTEADYYQPRLRLRDVGVVELVEPGQEQDPVQENHNKPGRASKTAKNAWAALKSIRGCYRARDDSDS